MYSALLAGEGEFRGKLLLLLQRLAPENTNVQGLSMLEQWLK